MEATYNGTLWWGPARDALTNVMEYSYPVATSAGGHATVVATASSMTAASVPLGDWDTHSPLEGENEAEMTAATATALMGAGRAGGGMVSRALSGVLGDVVRR